MGESTLLSSWTSGLSVGQNGPGQTPRNDGVTNLRKFVFNLNPLATDGATKSFGRVQVIQAP